MTKLPTLLLVVLTTPLANAFGFADIQNWTGTGDNRAALVIDFKNGGPAYAWGYRFSGTKTGFDLLTDVSDADPSLSYTFTQYSFGKAVTAIQYGNFGQAGFDSGSQGYWAYYLGAGTTAPTTWTSSSTGYEGRILGVDSWDGWSWAPGFNATAPNANIVAAAPVPEPASMILLGLGSLALLRRRRRS